MHGDRRAPERRRQSARFPSECLARPATRQNARGPRWAKSGRLRLDAFRLRAPLERSKIARDPRVSGVIVNRLEVLRFDDEAVDSRIFGQARSDTTHQVLDKPWIVVRSLGDV